MATGALFHPRLQRNLQKLSRCHRDENLQYGYTSTRYTSTRCDGKICWQINCQYYYKSSQYFCNFSEDVTLPAQDILHRNLRMWRQCNNLFKLHRYCESKIARVARLKTFAIFFGGGSPKSGAIFLVSKFKMVITLFKILKERSFHTLFLGYEY